MRAGGARQQSISTLNRHGALHHARHKIHDADEICHEGAGRLRVDVARRAQLLDPPLVHDDDAVGHGLGLFLVVCDHDGRNAQALLQIADFLAQPHPHFGVQSRQRLIQQEQAWRGGQCARQRHPLLLTARQLGRVLVAMADQSHQLHQITNAGIDASGNRALVLHAERDVLRAGHVREQSVRLEHDAKVAARGRQLADVAPVLHDLTGRLQRQPGYTAQQGGFAATRGSEQADELALCDVKRHLVKRCETAEAFAQGLDLKVGLGSVTVVERRGKPLLFEHGGVL